MKTRIIFLVIVSVFSFSPAMGDVVIGNGFTCSGNSIFKGAKEVKFKKAKSNMKKTIAALKVKLGEAPKNQKDGIKEKIAAANNSKTLISACSKGQLDAGQVDPIFTSLASGSGIYSGDYSGNVQILFFNQPISGNMNITFFLDGTIFSAIMTLGGNLASALKAEPLTFSNDVGGIGFPAQFLLQNTFIGDVTLSVSQNGDLTITNANSANATVNFDGQFSGQSITMGLTGSYSGSTFQGSATLQKQ